MCILSKIALFNQNHDKGGLVTRTSFSSRAWDLDYTQREFMCSRKTGKTNAIPWGRSLTWESMKMIWRPLLPINGQAWSWTWEWNSIGGWKVGVECDGFGGSSQRQTLDGKQKVCHRKQEVKPQRNTMYIQRESVFVCNVQILLFI